jgi:hypothetical protein
VPVVPALLVRVPVRVPVRGLALVALVRGRAPVVRRAFAAC